eukprot:Pgem_evm1s2862
MIFFLILLMCVIITGPQFVGILLKLEILTLIIEIFEFNEASLSFVCFQLLELLFSQSCEAVFLFEENLNGMECLEYFQFNNENKELSEMATVLYKSYFNDDNEEENASNVDVCDYNVNNKVTFDF